MNHLFLTELIKTVLDSTRPGLGFFNEFAEKLLSFPYSETRINHIVQLWDCVFKSGEYQQLTYFSSSKLNLVGVNRRAIMRSPSPITQKSNIKGIVDDTFVWANNFIAFPIKVSNTFSSQVKIEGALLLLSYSEEPIGFDNYQLSILDTVFTLKKPVVDEAPCVKDSLSEFRVVSNKSYSIAEKWTHTLAALKWLSLDKCKKGDGGVNYASFWKINKTERIKEDSILKQMECCYGELDLPTESNVLVSPSSKHFLRQYSNTLADGQSNSLEWPISALPMSRVKDSFTDVDFYEHLSPNDERLSVLVIPVMIDAPLKSIDICCLFVKDIIFTPFISDAFLNQLRTEIYADFSFLNDELQSRMSRNLMSLPARDSHYVSFCTKISQVVSSYNSVAETLIYSLDSSNNLLLTSKEDLNTPATFLTKSVKIGSHSCFLPEPYSRDKNFKHFLSSLRILDVQERYSQIVTYQPAEKTDVVRNALAMAICDPEYTKASGILLLINKVHSTESKNVKIYDNITVDNVIIIYLCSTILYQFDRWNKAATRKNFLLKKLRHEIPHCTKGISDKVGHIQKRLYEKGLVDSDINQSFLSIMLNNNRINTLASFFAAVDYEDKRFAEKRKKIDIIEEIESNLPLFREDALSKGCDVKIEKEVGLKTLPLVVSDFFPMAIVNVVNNAIRYCSFGTNIVIEISSSKIVVSDIGIPIPLHERELIFDDGFRGSNAKERDAQGIGYGLHLSRRVLNAHLSNIHVDSVTIADENVVLERIIYNYIKSLSQDERNRYIHNDTQPAEESVLNELLYRISQRQEVEAYSKYYNNRLPMIKSWLEKDLIMGGPSFIVMDDLWFQDPIAFVSFTINLLSVRI